MINLTCPSCRSELSIDEGFRGGVCRCFNCGTMMTVPEDPDHQPAESLERPGQPGATASPVAAKKPAATRQSTGRDPVATRPSSSQTRLFIIGIFLLIIGGMIGLVIYGAILMRDAKPATVVVSGVDAHRAVFDIVDNPYLNNAPQFMGVAAADSNVWMIDSSVAMRDYFDFAKAAVAASIPKMGGRSLQIIVCNEGGPIATPDAPAAAQSINVGDVASKLDGVLPSGGLTMKPAFDRASVAKPQQITLICRNAPDDAEIKAIAASLAGDNKPKLFIIQIDAADPALETLAKDTGGKLINVSPGQIQRWYQEYATRKQ